MPLHPYKSKLYYSTDGAAYTKFSSLRLVTPSDMERSESSVTHLESDDFAEEFIASWIKAGEMPFELLFDQAQFSTARTLFKDGNKLWWRVELPLATGQTTPAKIEARGHLKKLGISEAQAESDDSYRMPALIKLSGLPTFTPGS